jgi:hypothetical protein
MSQLRILLATLFIFSLSSFMSTPTGFSKPSVVGKVNQQIKIKYRPFAGRGPAKTGTTGGKRGCAIAQNPKNEKGIPYGLAPKDGVGRTVSTQPVIWVYSPYQTQSPLGVTLIVRQVADNGQEEQIGEETSLTISGNSGLSPVQVTQPLQDGKMYKWVVTFECDRDSAANPIVTGSIAVDVNAKLQRSLQSVAPRQQMVTYAQEGYWYDVLNQLLSNAAAKSDLEDFLRSGGLETAINKPIH